MHKADDLHGCHGLKIVPAPFSKMHKADEQHRHRFELIRC